ncbi:MAG: GNAT family N-acetyltransferase [Planctomycetota bacterium]
MTDAATEIRLEAITPENWRAVARLKVAPGQEGLVATNCCSLAQAAYEPNCFPRAVCRGDEPVGFVMYDHEPDGRTYYVMRLMTDQERQRQGVARQALRLAIAEIRDRVPNATIRISWKPQNTVAAALYFAEGFVETGVEDGEVVAELRDSPERGDA